MHRWLVVLSLSLMLGLLSVVPSWAATDLGQLCWETNFVDTLSAEVTQMTTNRFALSEVVWRAQTLYQFVGVSAAALRHPADGTIQFAPMLVSNDSDLFNGNHDCRIEISLLATTVSGTFTIVCGPGPLQPANAPFAIGGNLTFLGACEQVTLAAQSLSRQQAGIRSAGEAPE